MSSGANLLPPDVATELADLRRRVADIERASGRHVPHLGGLADVNGIPTEDGQVLAYDRDSGRWVPRVPSVAVPHLVRKSLGGGISLGTSYASYATLLGINTTNANSWLVVDIVCDFENVSSGGLVATGRVLIGGVAPDAGEAIFHESAQRATVGQHYTQLIPLASGPHTITLQARKLVGAGDIVLHDAHTSLRVLVVG